MRGKIEANLENATLEEVERARRCGLTQAAYRRLFAMELIYRGFKREEVGRILDVSSRTMQRLIRCFNERGIDGVIERGEAGRPRIIERERFAEEVVPLILHPEQCEEFHWTAVKFLGHLREKRGLELSYRTLLRYLKEQDIKLLVPRRWPERQDPEEHAAFVSKTKELLKNADVEFWFSDECGIEGDPRPRRRWAKRGSRPRLPTSQAHLRMNVTGAVCPQTGKAFALTLPYGDKETFQVFLDEFAKSVPPVSDRRMILVLDNASWHKSPAINWHHFEPMYLPPYSPDLNPIEVLWKVLKDRFFTDWYARTLEQLEDRVCQGLKALINCPETIASICTLSKYR